MNKIIEISSLHYSINNKKILDDINISFGKGEFIGLIGPNGAGKTTLLKSINGINELDAGDIKIAGKDIRKMKDKELAKEVALMNQNTSISFAFPCGEIVMMGRYPYSRTFGGFTKEDSEIVNKYMNFTDTINFKDRLITQLSGGERQRVLFAKVLAQETDVILLDEPTASLDITHEEQIFKYSKELSDKGKTVIAAVHDLRIAIKYCSKLVLLDKGGIVKEGTAEEVITEENLKTAYGINSQVYFNTVSNSLDFFVR
ncbi:ABC transporter ATP-binding protein [Oceanirhabdus seepicola]|uniref:ABC transporter ATP-binding protein n=1 Tax=Oceanirhabdus seepicola TaxID=2828781 RepID=A0A9J6P7N9_9CLOT|nr:ABC transporter ATP-binding protein [Oceanirhabdus seepicola]MCM1992292.1 ABC transporter ATP-binding protein [Oceanirhabdus seepicola]